MKKRFLIFICVLTVACAALSLCACDKKSDDENCAIELSLANYADYVDLECHITAVPRYYADAGMTKYIYRIEGSVSAKDNVAKFERAVLMLGYGDIDIGVKYYCDLDNYGNGTFVYLTSSETLTANEAPEFKVLAVKGKVYLS